MEVEKGTVSVADGSELQQALQNAVNQSSKTDRLLEKVNDLQAQIQETSKGGVHLGPQGQ
jgi:fido (protein-threonine AMPylation protein)